MSQTEFRVYLSDPNQAILVPLKENGITKKYIGEIKNYVQTRFNITDISSFNLVLQSSESSSLSTIQPLTSFTGTVMLKIQKLTEAIQIPSFIFTLIAGGSGIGKTRAAEEIKSPIYIYIKLNENGSRFDPEIDNLGSDVRIGSRLAFSSGIIQMDKINHILRLGQPIFNFTFEKIFNLIKESIDTNMPKAIIIHLDEYQIYIEEIKRYRRYTNLEDARSEFKLMLEQIGSMMKKEKLHYFIPICTGTSSHDINFQKTEFGKHNVNLNPLSTSSLDPFQQFHLGNMISITKSSIYKIALGDTGYIPREMLFLFDNIKINVDDFGTSTFFRSTRPIQDSTISKNTIRNLCAMGISQIPVSLDDYVINDPPISLDDIRGDGYIYLIEDKKNSKVQFTIFMSFDTFKYFNANISEFWFPDNLLMIPSENSKWNWQNFELFYPFFQFCLFSSYNILKREILFSNIFRGADGIDGLPKDPIIFYPQKVSCEIKSDISSHLVSHSDNNVLEDFTNSPSLFKCSINTPSFDHRFTIKTKTNTYLVYVQVKHSSLDSSGEVSGQTLFNYAKEAYLKIKNVYPSYPKILFYPTNRVINGSSSACTSFNEGFPGNFLIVFHRDNLSSFLSPIFSHRGLMDTIKVDI
eukprot:gene13116-16002_t